MDPYLFLTIICPKTLVQIKAPFNPTLSSISQVFRSNSSIDPSFSRPFLLTDGLIEAMSPSGQALGRDRVQKTLMATYGLPVAQQAHALVDLVQTHQDTDHQQDDITIVMVDV